MTKLDTDSAASHTDLRPAQAGIGPAGSGSRRVLNALIDLIEREGIRVGDRLPPEIDLAQRLNVGRSTIREALKAWQSMGIVVRNKGAGTRLAAEVSANAIHVPLTLKLEGESLLRTHSVRRPLEIEAVRHATRNATPQQRRIIVARVAELIAVYEAGEDWRDADHRFHGAIHEASGNPLFEQLIHQIQRAFQDIYEAPFGRPQLGAATIPLHLDLAEAIAAGDEEAAVRVTTRIMDMVEVEVREHMAGHGNV
ncbi:FadR/GntR family transcriptional regulator [Nitratireductor pacificus]|uniref:GntR family transcriptional regulator n=1 Tax=Nitratireductor pacificus pht-3B TaxID=391937 RepID=K2M7I5_9HYPH|nr:FCD domain-containing protein [Nitratireductor pacificus]EKF18141.1 GntR family transcriptional regulator [Nitratireductor pacificus pht-3B]